MSAARITFAASLRRGAHSRASVSSTVASSSCEAAATLVSRFTMRQPVCATLRARRSNASESLRGHERQHRLRAVDERQVGRDGQAGNDVQWRVEHVSVKRAAPDQGRHFFERARARQLARRPARGSTACRPR